MRTVIKKSSRVCAILACVAAFSSTAAPDDKKDVPAPKTVTPIQHIVVIFQENVSVDHYFATYPYAANNNPGEPSFGASSDTPSMNNLLSAGLLTGNPNSAQPFRLSRAQNYTCDQGHDYKPEQQAFNNGLMDKFPESVGAGGGNPPWNHPHVIPAPFSRSPMFRAVFPKPT